MRGKSINDEIYKETIEVNVPKRELIWNKVTTELKYYYAPEKLKIDSTERISDFLYMRYLKSALTWIGYDEIHPEGRRNFLWKPIKK